MFFLSDIPKQKYVLLSGILSVLLSLIVIFGWYTHNQTLVQVLPSFAPMQYNTALGFFFSGMGLLFISFGQFRLSGFFGVLTFLLGSATLIQYIWDVDFGIDELFVEPTFITRTSHPGRMAPNTALCFSVSGLILLLISQRTKKAFPLVVGFTFSLLALAGLALLGYFISQDSLYGWGTLTRMAIHTITGFFITGFGLSIYGLNKSKEQHIDKWQFAPPIITVTIIIVTIFSWYTYKEIAKERNEAHLTALIKDTQELLLDRFRLYEEGLRGGLGLHYASKNVTKSEWEIFVSALLLDEYLTGIRGIGYIDYVKSNDLETYLDTVRKDDMPDFINHPETSFSDKLIVRFIEPIDKNIESVGLDISFEKNRRAAAELSRDTGKPALTKKIFLVQDHEHKPGFLLLIPVYDTIVIPPTLEERREHIKGWVFAPFIGENFLNNINKINNNQLELEVYDDENILSKETLIYSSILSKGKDTAFDKNMQKETLLEIGAKHWKILWYSNEKFIPLMDEKFAHIILIFGCFLSFFLQIILNQILHSKKLIQKEVLEQTQALRESEQRYKAILDNTVDAIITADSDGTILGFNLAAEKIFGYKADEALGDNISIIIPEPHKSNHSKYVQKYFTTGEAKVIGKALELEGKKRNGEPFPMELSVGEVLLPDRRIFSAIIRDITETKKSKELILNMYEELQQSTDSLKQANQLKSEFLANMSHEIRTPLNGIVGAADLLLKTKISSEQSRYLNIITGSSDRLLGLINNILDLSKIEAGELSINPEPVVIRDLIYDIVQSIIPKANEKNLEIITHYGDEVPETIMADPIRIGQILINLLGNAIKFVSEGHIAIYIEAKKKEDQKIELSCTVEDTGIGIPEDKLETIFDEFTQADATTTKKYGGTGLGLAITHKLIEMMDGSIHAESTLNVGTKFIFNIPFDIAVIDSHEEHEDVYEDNIKNLRVLVVDDSSIILKFISTALIKLNIEHDTTADPIEALDILKNSEKKYDVLLTDYQMPKLNGLELAEKIKKDPETEDMKVLLMTAMGRMKMDDKNIKKDLFEECLFKPISPEDLSKSFHKMIKKKSVLKAKTPKKKKKTKSASALNLKVLLVENEMVNQMIAMDMLESIGCSVDLAEDGQIAVNTFFEQEPGYYDVIFMDCMMPVMDGFEATIEIRKQENEKNLPHQLIIAMTANAMADEKDKCINVGMDDYLAKPVKEETLREKLEEYF